MAKMPTAKLFVNLSASQTRKRLKGYGFGVKRVEAAGRKQSVIIHTALGRHLEELKRLFADASPTETETAEAAPLETLRNLGPTTARWLQDAGVATSEDLKRIGAALAYQRVKQQRGEASLNLLWALAGALEDRDWRTLTPAEKQSLREELDD